MDRRTVGILGGGQLGRMLVGAAQNLGVRTAILDPAGPSSPAGQLASICVEGGYQNGDKILELAGVSDVVTTEIEHVDTAVLSKIHASGKVVHPHPEDIAIIQDKFQQKKHLSARGIPVCEFTDIDDVQAAERFGSDVGYPFVLKNRLLAYDGRGNAIVNSEGDIPGQMGKLGRANLYAERKVPFAKELAVMVVRCKEGTFAYPVTETVQTNGVCSLVIAPAQIPAAAYRTAEETALRTAGCFQGYGVFGVEMFLLDDDSVLVNEIAPRPHNSGHCTIEACELSQFEMHLRAILGLPCPPPRLRAPYALMLNVLGKETMDATKTVLHRALCVPGAAVHWYAKLENRPGRKMAHITVTADNVAQLRERAELLGVPERMHNLPAPGPRVGVIMGSDSDLSVMREAADVLEQFGVAFELTIVSAHRTPARLYAYAQSAAERGLQVVIAGAGGAAHLPGMVAALTSLPVIGVPIHTAALGGQDSLLSIVQMPRGVPVATVAIGGAANAGLLAVRMLAAQDKALLAKMDAYLLKQEEEVLRKASKLESAGYKVYTP